MCAYIAPGYVCIKLQKALHNWSGQIQPCMSTAQLNLWAADNLAPLDMTFLSIIA